MSTTQDNVEANGNLLRASLQSGASLMGLQLMSRLFTFILNQALLRLASPKVFGTAAIQFELLVSTILFLSREGARNAALRKSTQAHDRQSIAPLGFLPFMLGCPLAVITTVSYCRLAVEETKNQPHFKLAIGLYALAAIIELLSEPMHMRAMGELQTDARVKAEGAAIVCKTLVTFLILLYDSRLGHVQGEYSLMAFAIGQLVYGTCILGLYMYHYGSATLLRAITSLSLKTKRSTPTYFDSELLGLTLTMTSQSLVKHLLTEGDKFILSWLRPLQDQGGYAIAVNYGSLVARIVFQPLEEMSRVFFSKVLATPPSGNTKRPSRHSLKQASSTLLSILAVQSSLTVVFIVFAYAYLPIALRVLLPSRYMSTSAPEVLSAWIWYIPFLAVNGVLEAFLSSAATSKELTRQSRWMGIFSVIYICAALLMYRLQFGDAALVYANIINLFARIVFSLHFVTAYFSMHGASDLLEWSVVRPNRRHLLLVILSALLIWLSQRNCDMHTGGTGVAFSVPVLLHVCLGGVLASICISTWWVCCGRALVPIKSD